MNKKHFSLFAILAFSLYFISCDKLRESFERTKNPKRIDLRQADDEIHSDTVAHSKAKTFQSLYHSAERLDSIQSELENLPELKGKKINIYHSLYFYDFKAGYISIRIQNPDSASYIDEYKYQNGEWQQPVPVKLSRLEKIDDGLMPFNEIKFSTAKIVHDVSMDKTKELGGKGNIQHVYFNFHNYAKNKKATWNTRIYGVRADYSAYFSIDGKFLEMR
ncbi:hypothetical protein [Sphingobacterium hungaricum]